MKSREQSGVVGMVLFVWAAVAIAGPARAAVLTTARTVDFQVTVGADPLFGDASAHIVNTFTIGAGSTGTTDYGGALYLAPPDATGVTLSSSGAVTVSPQVATAGAPVPVSVSATGAGSWSYSEDASPDTFLNYSVFSPALHSGKVVSDLNRYVGDASLTALSAGFATVQGHELLDITVPAAGIVDAGGAFNVDLSIDGDWTAKRVTHGHGTISLNPKGWTLSPYTYDPTTDRTYVSADNPNFQPSEEGPFLEIFLVGPQVVPEPGAVAMLAVGGLALAFARRRREPATDRAVARPTAPIVPWPARDGAFHAPYRARRRSDLN